MRLRLGRANRRVDPLLISGQVEPPARRVGAAPSSLGRGSVARRTAGAGGVGSRPRSRPVRSTSSTARGHRLRRRAGPQGRSGPRPGRSRPGARLAGHRPLPTSICWVGQSSLELDETRTKRIESSGPSIRRGGIGARPRGPGSPGPAPSSRSGNPLARIPAQPQARCPGGTMVQLVDRPALKLGQGTQAARAGERSCRPDLVFYIKADGVRWARPTPPGPPAAERRTSTRSRSSRREAKTGRSAQSASIPPRSRRSWNGSTRRTAPSSPASRSEQWRIRYGARGLSGPAQACRDRLDVEETIRGRLAGLARNEQAAQAAARSSRSWPGRSP